MRTVVNVELFKPRLVTKEPTLTNPSFQNVPQLCTDSLLWRTTSRNVTDNSSAAGNFLFLPCWPRPPDSQLTSHSHRNFPKSLLVTSEQTSLFDVTSLFRLKASRHRFNFKLLLKPFHQQILSLKNRITVACVTSSVGPKYILYIHPYIYIYKSIKDAPNNAVQLRFVWLLTFRSWTSLISV